ncbi:hypothetical protein RB594_006671 [Gaeumannomyces avenae]
MSDDPQTEDLDPYYQQTVDLGGREYQRYAIENGAYFVPVDEDEEERLRLMHDVFQLLFDGALIFPPIRNPRRILDCGFGTASWAVDVAEAHPNCIVNGVDISPLMAPEEPPENVVLDVDDLNRAGLSFEHNTFDIVHSRMVAGGIHADRWPRYIRDIRHVLQPGGWCQMVEIYFNAQSDNGTLTENHALRQWSSRYLQSMVPYKDPRSPLNLATLMTEAGFTDVQTMVYRLPMSAWSSDPREYAIGVANRDNVRRLLGSHAMYPFTTRLGMSVTEVQLLVARARHEADNPAFKAYFPVYVCYGRKPRRASG